MYCASTWALEGYCDSLAYEIAPFNIKMTIVQPNKEIPVLSNKIIFAPQLPQYDSHNNPAPGLRDILTNVINLNPETRISDVKGKSGGDKIVSRYPKLSNEAKDRLVMEAVHALTAIGGHENRKSTPWGKRAYFTSQELLTLRSCRKRKLRHFLRVKSSWGAFSSLLPNITLLSNHFNIFYQHQQDTLSDLVNLNSHIAISFLQGILGMKLSWKYCAKLPLTSGFHSSQDSSTSHGYLPTPNLPYWFFLEGVASVKEKLKTVSEELEDFVEVSCAVDIFKSDVGRAALLGGVKGGDSAPDNEASITSWYDYPRLESMVYAMYCTQMSRLGWSWGYHTWLVSSYR